MSVTDRAFIKAYAPREAHASAVPACHLPLGASHEAKPVAEEPYRPAAKTAGNTGGQTAPITRPYRGMAPLGTYGVSLSAPANPAPPKPTPAVQAPVMPPAEPAPMPAAPAPVAAAALQSTANCETATQPLSSFAAPEEVIEEEATLTPALEVEEFLWPEVCTELLAKTESSFDQWAAKLAQQAINGHNVIMLSGLARHEGRTTALLCLARRLAKAGVRTALVDGDFQKPGLAEALGIAVIAGWDEVLTTGAPLQEALVVSKQDELTLLPLGEPIARPQQLVRNLQVAVGLRALSDQYDVVLVDAGPVLGSNATAVALMQQLDEVNVVLMRNVQSTPVEALAEAEQQLTAARVRLLGVAETFCPLPGEVQRQAESSHAA